MDARCLLRIVVFLGLLVPPFALADAAPIQMSAGHSHTCLLRDNKVHCWGNNEKGQSTTPELQAPTEIAAGGNLSCAIDQRKVHCWGDLQGNKLNPPQFDNPTKIQLSNSGDAACVLENSKLKCWGMIPDNFFNRMLRSGDTYMYSKPDDVVAYSLGDGHMCSHEIKDLYCSLYFITPHAHQIGSLPKKWRVPLNLFSIKTFVVGNNQACAIDSLQLKCWLTHYNQEVKIPFIKNPVAIDVKSSGCGLNDEEVKCWGEINLEEKFPKGVAIAVGDRHVCAVSETDIGCWGANDMQQLNYQAQRDNTWASIPGQPVSIEYTDQPDQVKIEFPDYRGLGLWKMSERGQQLVGLPDGKPRLIFTNLADTGCYIERIIGDNHDDKLITNIYPTKVNDTLVDCNSPQSPLYMTEVSAAVKFERQDGTRKITFLDSDLLKPYQGSSGEFLVGDPVFTENGRHLVIYPQHFSLYEKLQYIAYSPEFLLLDVQEHKAYRIAVSNQIVSPDIASYQNNFVLSFSGGSLSYGYAEPSSFGDLWLFNPQSFSLEPIKGEQRGACGGADISIRRDRLHSETESATVCGGSYHSHQARFVSPTEIELTYSDYKDGEGDEIIDWLYDNHKVTLRDDAKLDGHYIYSVNENQLTLTPAGPRYQWPMALLWQTPDASPSTASAEIKVGAMDGWFEFNRLHLSLVLESQVKTEKIHLNFNFLMVDASVTNRNDYDSKRRNETWTLGYTLHLNPLQITLDNKDQLAQAGLPVDVLNGLESRILLQKPIVEKSGKTNYELMINLVEFPVKALDNSIGFQLQIEDQQGRIVQLDQAHSSYWKEWHYFPLLEKRLESSWGTDSLPATIVDGKYTHALRVSEQLYLFAPESQTFKPYQEKQVDQSWLDEHSAMFHRLSESDLTQLTATHALDRVFYSRTPEQVNLYQFIHESSVQPTHHILVSEYDIEGNYLRSSPLFNYYTGCYRYCDDTPELDLNDIALYQINERFTLVSASGTNVVFDHHNFQWVVGPGKLADLVDAIAQADIDNFPKDFSLSEYNPTLEIPFGVFAKQPVGQDQINIHANKYKEPLSGTEYSDPSLAECINAAMLEMIGLKPEATINDLSNLQCRDGEIDSLQGIEQLHQLQTLSLLLGKDVSLQPLRNLKQLHQLTLGSEQIDLTPLAGVNLERLDLTLPSLNLQQLSGARVRDLQIKTKGLQIAHLAQIKGLRVLDLADSELVMPEVAEGLVLSDTLEQLIHKKHQQHSLLDYFPALRQAELASYKGAGCPASTMIEQLTVRGFERLPKAECFPQLQRASFLSRDCLDRSGAPFAKVTQLTSYCFSSSDRSFFPALRVLETHDIDSVLPSIQKLVLDQWPTCPEDKLFSEISSLALTCTLVSNQQMDAIKISGKFTLAKTANNLVEGYPIALTLDVSDKKNLKDIWPISQGYRALQLANLEQLDITIRGNFPLGELLAQTPRLKQLSIQFLFSNLDSNFVLQLPPLNNLEHLKIKGYPALDLTQLIQAPLKTLVIEKWGDNKLTVIADWKKLAQLAQLEQLELPYGFQIAPAELPCNLRQLSAHLKLDSVEDASSCSPLQQVVFRGELRNPAAALFHRQLPASVRRYSGSVSADSVLWVEADFNKFNAVHTLTMEQEAEVEKSCRSNNTTLTLSEGALIEVGCLNRLLKDDH